MTKWKIITLSRELFENPRFEPVELVSTMYIPSDNGCAVYRLMKIYMSSCSLYKYSSNDLIEHKLSMRGHVDVLLGQGYENVSDNTTMEEETSRQLVRNIEI